MKKLLSLSVLLLLSFVANVNSAMSAPNEDQAKWGVGLSRGIINGSPIMAMLPGGGYTALDFFGEYKFNDASGLRLSVQPTFSNFSDFSENALQDNIYMNVSFIFRHYVGTKKQLCLFFGPQMAFLLSAKYKPQNLGTQKGEVRNLLDKKDCEAVFGSDAVLNKAVTSLKLGWDYEFEGGFILGGIFTSEWLNGGSESSQQSGKVAVHWFVPTQQLLYIGYNFAQLFR